MQKYRIRSGIPVFAQSSGNPFNRAHSTGVNTRKRPVALPGFMRLPSHFLFAEFFARFPLLFARFQIIFRKQKNLEGDGIFLGLNSHALLTKLSSG